MKHWLEVKGKIRTPNICVIVCHFALILSLCACSSPTFPSGIFSIKAYSKEPSIESTQQNNIKEDVENNFAAGAVITPENADLVTVVNRIHTGRYAYCLDISPDGRLLATGGLRNIKLWDMASREALRTLDVPAYQVRSLAFTADGRLLISGGNEDNTIRLWDTANGEALRTLEMPTNAVNDLAISPDGLVLAAIGHSTHNSGNTYWSGNDDIVMLWDVDSGQLLRSIEPDIWNVSSIAFSPDGLTLAVGGYDGIGLWDTVSWERLHTLDTHTNNLTFSPDGRLLASGGASGEPYENVILWDTESGSSLRMLEGYDDAVMSLAFSPDGRLVVAAGWKGMVLWEVASGKILNTFSFQPADESTHLSTPLVWQVAFSPDGRLLASVDVNANLTLRGIP